MNSSERPRTVVYCEGAFTTTNGKTAHGLVRRSERYQHVPMDPFSAECIYSQGERIAQHMRKDRIATLGHTGLTYDMRAFSIATRSRLAIWGRTAHDAHALYVVEPGRR